MEPLIAGALLFCNPGQPGPYPAAAVVVDAFVQAYNRQDAKGIAALVSQDAVILRGDQSLDGDELARNYRDNLFTLDKPFRITVRSRLAEGNMVAQVEDTASDDTPVEPMLSTYEVRHGCIVRMTASIPTDAGQD